MTAETLPPIEDAEAFKLEYDDVSLAGYAWWAEQQAPALLMLHGWGEDASTLAPVARLIRSRRWHAVSISMRGWRGSTGTDDYGLSAPKDLGRVLDWLRNQPRVGGTVLLGFSMGGVMASLAAARQTDLTGIVVVGAPSHLPTVYSETAYGGVRRYFDATLQPQQWEQSSPLTHAARIGAPMVIVTGGQDQMCPPAQGAAMAKLVPKSRLFHDPAMGHHPDQEQWQRVLDVAAEHIGLGVPGGGLERGQ
ncbi:alpha/beta hydrolase family protein [Arthrobacter castelli]|uniref:alpha/beta hydrolase family protein n=1 Tax=Arthrobacter castelli TaxID=271431 RepID=UPI00040204B7|nr:alpha/beta fold hydrolase [Arthrobacter castelli]